MPDLLVPIVPHGTIHFYVFLQDVTVDGTVVLSKSGPHRWDWVNRFHRPKDEGYKLHVTDTGIEIRLEEQAVWGVAADEWLG